MTPKELRARAEREDAAVLAAVERGDLEAARAALKRAHLLRVLADELTASQQKRTVGRGMTDGHRANLSRARGGNSEAMEYARIAGYPSLSAIAEAMGVDKGFLSKAFRGDRPMPAERAEQFEKLTKYPAARWKS